MHPTIGPHQDPRTELHRAHWQQARTTDWYKSHAALPLDNKKGANLTPEKEKFLNKKFKKKKIRRTMMK